MGRKTILEKEKRIANSILFYNMHLGFEIVETENLVPPLRGGLLLPCLSDVRTSISPRVAVENMS